jgi:hypothetical protein
MSRPKAHRRKRTTIITITIITIIIIITNITIITTTTARPKKCNLGDASDGGVFGRRQFLRARRYCRVGSNARHGRSQAAAASLSVGTLVSSQPCTEDALLRRAGPLGRPRRLHRSGRKTLVGRTNEDGAPVLYKSFRDVFRVTLSAPPHTSRPTL